MLEEQLVLPVQKIQTLYSPALQTFEAPYLEEKLLTENVFGTQESYQTAFDEFKKYASIAKSIPGSVAMTSKEVDTVWHQFILFTKPYMEFCDNFLGSYLHHSPNTSYTPEVSGSVNRFRESYRSAFGDIPEIWGLKEWCDSGSCGDGGGSCGNDCASCGSDGND